MFESRERQILYEFASDRSAKISSAAQTTYSFILCLFPDLKLTKVHSVNELLCRSKAYTAASTGDHCDFSVKSFWNQFSLSHITNRLFIYLKQYDLTQLVRTWYCEICCYSPMSAYRYYYLKFGDNYLLFL
jgi:hypothetical protein